jgi:hypothetical protein
MFSISTMVENAIAKKNVTSFDVLADPVGDENNAD